MKFHWHRWTREFLIYALVIGACAITSVFVALDLQDYGFWFITWFLIVLTGVAVALMFFVASDTPKDHE